MPRPLSQIQAEILRVAEERGEHPAQLQAKHFLAHEGVSATKWDLTAYGGWAKVKADAALSAGQGRAIEEKETRGIELRNLANRRALTREATDHYLADTLRTAIAEAIRDNPIVLGKKPPLPKHEPMLRLLTLLWSDLHFGVTVDPREVLGSEYNWTIAARRMAKLVMQAAEWKPQHRAETALAVVLNGDLIEGVIHLDSTNIRPLAEQIRGATYILVAALDYLRQHFHRIDVHCLPGNHDRATYRGLGRSTAQRWDGHADAIYLAIEQAFRGAEDIAIHVPRSGIAQYRTPGGHLIVAMHGDVEPSVANVGRSLHVAKIQAKLYALDASKAFDAPVSVMLAGHWHSPLLALMPNGASLVVNGCLIGGSTWSQNGVGQYNAEPAQVMFESVASYPMGDFRIVRVRDADADAAYDAVIPTPRVE